MNLSDKTILKEMESGNIIIEPFEPKHLNPNSIDLTLNPAYKMVSQDNLLTATEREDIFAQLNGLSHQDRIEMNPNASDDDVHEIMDIAGIPRWFVDCKKSNNFREGIVPEGGMVLVPGELYIYHCNEKVGCKKNIRATVMGKSSIGRLGLFVHVTAGFVDTGFEGSLVLEMVPTIPIRIYPNQKICQLEFVRVEGEFNETYDQKEGSKYMNQTGSQTSKMHENFDQSINNETHHPALGDEEIMKMLQKEHENPGHVDSEEID